MASSSKRPHLLLETPDNTESSSSSSSASESDEDEGEDVTDQEIQVEFEARTPEAFDADGILRLLKQAFRGQLAAASALDLTALSAAIIQQRNIGSVITQTMESLDNEDESDEENEDEDLAREVLGLATIIRICAGEEVSDQLIRYISTTASAARGSGAHEIAKLVTNKDNRVGFLISERFVNIPAQISVPLLETLYNEIRKAQAKRLPYDFTHYVMVSKLLLPKGQLGAAMYLNAEEEVFVPEAEFTADFDIDSPLEDAASSSSDFTPRRKLVVFRADRFEPIIARVKTSFPIA